MHLVINPFTHQASNQTKQPSIQPNQQTTQQLFKRQTVQEPIAKSQQTNQQKYQTQKISEVDSSSYWHNPATRP